MPVRQSQSCDGLPFDAVPTAPSRIAAGQISVRDLQAGTSIVATEGTLQLSFRDHSLAWLGNAVPPTSITLHEGEQFVTPQRGVVSISAASPGSVAFVVQTSRAENVARRVVNQAVHRLAALVNAKRRRIA